MHRWSLTAALLAATRAADANGAHARALARVLAAIPALAWTSLAYFGELVDGRAADDTGALNVGLASLALALVVLGAGARANALDGAEVVVERHEGCARADDHEPRPATVVRGAERIELAEEASRQREPGKAEH